jgi:hypothetical protein
MPSHDCQKLINFSDPMQNAELMSIFPSAEYPNDKPMMTTRDLMFFLSPFLQFAQKSEGQVYVSSACGFAW